MKWLACVTVCMMRQYQRAHLRQQARPHFYPRLHPSSAALKVTCLTPTCGVVASKIHFYHKARYVFFSTFICLFYYHQLISPCLLPLLVRMNESTADALSAISLRRFSPSLSSFVADRHLSSVPEMKVNECIKIDISSYFMHP